MIRDPALLEALRDSVARFVRERLVLIEERVSEEDRIGADVIEDMRALGLFGMTIPEEFGGLGLTMEEVLVTFELGQTSPAFRSLIGTNNGIGSLSLIAAGTPQQKLKYLPRMADGSIIASFALPIAPCRFTEVPATWPSTP